MHVQQQALELLGIPLWLEKSAIEEASPQNLVFLSETKERFTPAHQEQLSKILNYLGLHDYQSIFLNTPHTSTEAAMILCFGVTQLPPISSTLPPCMTLSISEMLSNPSCKRQVMNELTPIKNACA